MRAGQTATLVTRPGAFFTGHGQTLGGWNLASIAFIFLMTIGGFWMATQKSVLERARESVAKRTDRLDTENIAKAYIVPIKAAFWGYIAVIAFSESGFKHIPGMEKRDTIGQWGPLVALALLALGIMLRQTIRKLIATYEKNPNITKAQKRQHDAAMGLVKPGEDAEETSATDTEDKSDTTSVTPPEDARVREVVANNSERGR